MKCCKSQQLSIQYVIIATLGVLALVVLSSGFTSRIGAFSQGVDAVYRPEQEVPTAYGGLGDEADTDVAKRTPPKNEMYGDSGPCSQEEDDWASMRINPPPGREMRTEISNDPTVRAEIVFAGYHRDTRKMHNGAIEMWLPEHVKISSDYRYDGRTLTVVPDADVRRDRYVRWDKNFGAKSDPRYQGNIKDGWSVTVRVHGVIPTRETPASVKVALSWEDEEGKQYCRVWPEFAYVVVEPADNDGDNGDNGDGLSCEACEKLAADVQKLTENVLKLETTTNTGSETLTRMAASIDDISQQIVEITSSVDHKLPDHIDELRSDVAPRLSQIRESISGLSVELGESRRGVESVIEELRGLSRDATWIRETLADNASGAYTVSASLTPIVIPKGDIGGRFTSGTSAEVMGWMPASRLWSSQVDRNSSRFDVGLGLRLQRHPAIATDSAKLVIYQPQVLARYRLVGAPDGHIELTPHIGAGVAFYDLPIDEPSSRVFATEGGIDLTFGLAPPYRARTALQTRIGYHRGDMESWFTSVGLGLLYAF